MCPAATSTDHQMRLYMKLRQTKAVPTGGAKPDLALPRPIASRRTRACPRRRRRRAEPPSRSSGRYLRRRGRADAEGGAGLRPMAIFEEMIRRHPSSAPACAARWSGASAPGERCTASEQDVIFPQVQEPGRMGLSDFTDMGELGVTIAGAAARASAVSLRARLFRLRACRGRARRRELRGLGEGLENALRLLGGAPREHRSDSLSAAFRNLTKDAAGSDPPLRGAVLHYGMTADPQQPRRRARERRHREPARPPQARIARGAAAARLARFRRARRLSPLRRRDGRPAQSPPRRSDRRRARRAAGRCPGAGQ